VCNYYRQYRPVSSCGGVVDSSDNALLLFPLGFSHRSSDLTRWHDSWCRWHQRLLFYMKPSNCKRQHNQDISITLTSHNKHLSQISRLKSCLLKYGKMKPLPTSVSTKSMVVIDWVSKYVVHNSNLANKAIYCPTKVENTTKYREYI